MRVLVTGGRTFGLVLFGENPNDPKVRERVARERQMAYAELSRIPAIATLVHGDANGADKLCAELWEGWGNVVEPHPANWKQYGKAAGAMRNQEMIDSGVDLVLALPGGTGTADCVARAKKAGVKVIEV